MSEVRPTSPNYALYFWCTFTGMGIGYLAFADPVLYLFAGIVFMVCGVTWELQHWKSPQEFSHGEEIREE